MKTSPEATFEVVWPLGKSAYTITPAGAGVASLKGKTVCELWDVMYKGEVVFPLLRELLQERYPGVKFVPYSEFGGTHGAQEVKTIAGLPQKLAQHHCDAVISGIGA